jgi:hypothetical protein
MSTNKQNPKESNTTVKETADCIYERLRSQIVRAGSAAATNSHVFFVFGASVCLIACHTIQFS